MKLTKGIEIHDLAIYLSKENVLVMSDFHIGYEEALSKQGIMIPKFQYKEVRERITKIFSKIGKEKFSKIVINGDVKHEFGGISEQEWRETLRLLDFLSEHCEEIVLIRGNHDKILGPIAEKRNVKVMDSINFGPVLICHGDKILDGVENAEVIIIGHEHPAITLKDEVRHEKYKCYLIGSFEGKKLIVQPSFNLVTEGTDIRREQILSPFLKQDLSKFEVVVLEDQEYQFGKLEEI